MNRKEPDIMEKLGMDWDKDVESCFIMMVGIMKVIGEMILLQGLAAYSTLLVSWPMQGTGIKEVFMDQA